MNKMKGKDLIKIIQENNLEEFEIKGNELISNTDPWGVCLKHYIIDELIDIGYSDKTATFSIIEL